MSLFRENLITLNINGLCMSLTGFYELGTKGGDSGGTDEGGFASDVLSDGEEASPIGRMKDGLANTTVGGERLGPLLTNTVLFRALTGFAIYGFFASLAYSAGQRVHTREIGHRNKVLSLNCAQLGFSYNRTATSQVPRNTPFDDPIGATITINTLALVLTCQESTRLE